MPSVQIHSHGSHFTFQPQQTLIMHFLHCFVMECLSVCLAGSPTPWGSPYFITVFPALIQHLGLHRPLQEPPASSIDSCVCFSFISVGVRRDFEQRPLGEERVYWPYTSRSQSNIGGHQGWNSRQELEEETTEECRWLAQSLAHAQLPFL